MTQSVDQNDGFEERTGSPGGPDEANATPEGDRDVETPWDTPRDVLEEQGEDVSSSPARRGHEGLLDGEE